MSIAVSHRVGSPADPVVGTVAEARADHRARIRTARARRADSALETWRASADAARAASEENRRCPRRVRHEARDVVGVVLFSAAASTGLAVAITLVLALVG